MLHGKSLAQSLEYSVFSTLLAAMNCQIYFLYSFKMTDAIYSAADFLDL